MKKSLLNLADSIVKHLKRDSEPERGKQVISEEVEAELTARFLQIQHQLEKFISQRMRSIEEKVELMEVKTNKLLGLYNDLEENLEERMLEIDRKLSLQNKR
jgi:hypothetical protein